MKRVIFLCLLSLTLCLSKPTELESPVLQATAKALKDVNLTANEQKPVASAQTTATPAVTAASVQAPVTTAQTPSPPEQAAPAGQPSSPSNTPPTHTEKEPNTMPPTVSNNTTEKKDDAANKKTSEGTHVETPAPNKAADVKPTPNNIKPEEKEPKTETSTPAHGSPKPTDASKTEEPKANASPKDEEKHIVQARGFDGPSFIGGIILSLGLLAIGFMGFKYYKNQTERNYHTL